MNRFFLLTSTFPLCFVGCCISWLFLVSAGDAAEKPNVLFLFADDFTNEAISAFGYLRLDIQTLKRRISISKSDESSTHSTDLEKRTIRRSSSRPTMGLPLEIMDSLASRTCMIIAFEFHLSL